MKTWQDPFLTDLKVNLVLCLPASRPDSWNPSIQTGKSFPNNGSYGSWRATIPGQSSWEVSPRLW